PVAVDPFPVRRDAEIGKYLRRSGPRDATVGRFEDADVGERQICVVERIISRAGRLPDRGDVLVAAADDWRYGEVPEARARVFRGPEIWVAGRRAIDAVMRVGPDARLGGAV